MALTWQCQRGSVLIRAERLPGQCWEGLGGTAGLSVVLACAESPAVAPGASSAGLPLLWKGCCLQHLAPSQSLRASRSRVAWGWLFFFFFSLSLSFLLVFIDPLAHSQGEPRADSCSNSAWGCGEREKKGCKGLTRSSASIYSFPTISNLSHLTILGT